MLRRAFPRLLFLSAAARLLLLLPIAVIPKRPISSGGRLRLLSVALPLALALALAASAGCGRFGEDARPSAAARGLEVGADAMLSSVDYVINGPMMFRQLGVLPVGASFTLMPTFSMLPSGANVTVNVRGTASDELTQCTGMASFAVPSSGVAMTSIPLSCSKPPSGSVSFSGGVNVCPVIDGLGALPAEARVGGTMIISGSAHDADNFPNAALRSRWMVTAGILQNPSLTGANFICNAVGPATILWEVTDGDNADDCPASATFNVNCTAP